MELIRVARAGAASLCAAVLMAAACTPVKPRTFGPLREVTVVSSYWYLIDSTVVSILQQPVLTPQPEAEFKLRVGSVDKFETFSRFRIVFLVGLPEDTLLRQILGPRVDSLSEGDYGLLKVPNAWQKDQFALIFIARDTSKLRPGLIAYGPRIRQTLREIVLGQMTMSVYIEGIDRALTDKLSAAHDFTIDVPRRWALDQDYADSGFVFIFGHVPDRTVFVHWQDTVLSLDPQSMAGLRDRLTGRFLAGDSLEPEYTQVDTIEFLAGPCLRMSGIWQNDREVIGGPFVNYSFNFRDRFYMVDGLVFDPGKKKLSALAQVEAVVRTFVPK